MIRRNQNTIFAIGFVLILFVAVWSLARPGILKLFQKSEDSDQKINEEILKAPLITPKDLYEKTRNKEKIFFFDTRSANEFQKGHLEMSESAPNDSLDPEKLKLSQVEKTSAIVVLNQGDDVFGAARKTNELVAAGYANARYLQGGISAWKNEGYPLVSNDIAGGEGKIKKISVADLAGDLSISVELVQFIDTRNPDDFRRGHIPGSLNVSLENIEKSKDKISLLKKIVVYGNREEASRAAVTLFDLNFFNAYVLEGGIETWKSAGGQIVVGSE